MWCSGATYTDAPNVEEEDLGLLGACHFRVDDVQNVLYNLCVF